MNKLVIINGWDSSFNTNYSYLLNTYKLIFEHYNTYENSYGSSSAITNKASANI